MIAVIAILTSIDLVCLAASKHPAWVIGHLLASGCGIALIVRYLVG